MTTLRGGSRQGVLATLAAAMKGQLAAVEKGYVHRALFGGLHVALERRGSQWRLAIAREKVAPSKTEMATVARDFGLPASVTWEVGEKLAQGRPFQPGTKLWVAECWWSEGRTSNQAM